MNWWLPGGGEAVPQSLSMTPQQPVKHAREDPIQPQVIHVTDAPDSLKDSTHIGTHNVYHLMKNQVIID